METGNKKQALTGKQLKEGELFYQNLIAESLDGIVLTDTNGIIDFASPSIKNILGYDAEEILGKTLFDFAHPEDIELAVRTFKEEITKEQKVKFINIRLIKKSGDLLWCKVRGHNMLEVPFVERMAIYFSDDTLRKNAENALIRSENRFRTQAIILQSVTDVIVTIDLNRNITSWNNVMEELTGIAEKNAIGKRFRDVIETDYSPFSQDQVISIVMNEGVWRGEISFIAKNGEKIYLLHTVSLLLSDNGEKFGFLGIGKDITERKQAELRLQQSELLYRRLSYYSNDGIVMTNASGVITYCSPSVDKVLGYGSAQVLEQSFFDFVHPDDLLNTSEAYSRELKNEAQASYLFVRLKHANGEWLWCTVRGHNLLTVPGLNTFVIYFTNDTIRKQAEDQLRESEEKFRSLIANLKQGVILLDNKAVTTICNDAALDMLGIEKSEILGKSVLEYSLNIIQENGQPFSGTIHPIAMLFRTRQLVKDVVVGIFHRQKKDIVWLLINAEPIVATDGSLVNFVCSLTDITEQKRLSKELIEQEIEKQKLVVQAAIDGQEKERQEIGKELHDNINQYLTTARLYLEVAKEKSTGEVKEMVNLSHKTLSDIVKEIRKLSQSLVPPTLGDIGLIESIQELCDSIRQAHTIKIEFYYRYFDEGILNGNMKLMLFRIIQEQVNNIIKHSEANNLIIDLRADAEFIMLKIKDDGIGFDLAKYKKGRGLVNISSRTSLINGKIDLETYPGKGCVLTVSIPISQME